jgi:hypothetical protein
MRTREDWKEYFWLTLPFLLFFIMIGALAYKGMEQDRKYMFYKEYYERKETP